jgi:hypothetical protein
VAVTHARSRLSHRLTEADLGRRALGYADTLARRSELEEFFRAPADGASASAFAAPSGLPPDGGAMTALDATMSQDEPPKLAGAGRGQRCGSH